MNEKSRSDSYAAAGVDITAGYKAVELMKTHIARTVLQGGSEDITVDRFDIRFDHVRFAYNHEEVLHDVSFTAKQGEITALVGPSGSGKSTLAKDLQKQLDCNVIHMDDFYLQPHQRTTKRMREPGGNVDYERFETEVLQPMLTGEAFSYRPYDAHAVCFLPEVIVSPKKVTIIEGSYACHPRLRRSYDLRIFLTVDRQEQLERIRKRNGEEREEMFERIWIPLEERYFWKAGVEKTCDISLDTTGLFEG